jgi:hypothetical protein
MFADLTGDYNPIHLDPVAARKTQAGVVVAHGIHAVLWSLDKLVESGAVDDQISSLSVQFRNFIPVNKQVELKLISSDDKSARLELCLGDLTALTLVVGFGARKAGRILEPSNAVRHSAPGLTATSLPFEEMAGLSGCLQAEERINDVQLRFPHASAAIGTCRVAGIALLSTLVGMVCPGLHSLFAGLAVEIADSAGMPDGISFQVIGTDQRFQMVRMRVFGSGIYGSVQAFQRRPPILQAPFSEITSIVAPSEFAGSVALIIGGSRGLGALTAKILAAGGGRVFLTYALGQADADKVMEEIRSQAACDDSRAFRYNVEEEAAPQLDALGTEITHLYYFATSAIARQKDGPFVMGLFDEFIRMYVRGFYDCCRYLSQNSSGVITAFYPSSVFVESQPPEMIEYSMAKMAGESLCRNINQVDGRIRIIVRRLPRLRTDQTATVLPVETQDPLAVMLPIVRDVQANASRCS